MTIAALIESVPSDRIALVGEHERDRSSYGELATSMQRARSALDLRGVGRQDRVMLSAASPMEAAAAFIAIAPSAIVAPIDPRARAREIEKTISQLEPRLVIAPEGSIAWATALERRVPAIPFERLLGAGRCPVDPSPDDLALLLATSGTTAKPRWVPLSHRNLCASAINVRDALGLGESDVCLNVMPHHHVQALVGALLASIAAGGTTISISSDAQLGGRGATWVTVSPAMLPHVMRGELRGLRFVRCTSAPLSEELQTEAERALGAPILVGYGMTETASQISSMTIAARKPGSVGRPFGPEVRIIDGEIAVRGPTIMRGYWRDPEATAETFAGEWLRTGDLGAIDGDGNLTVVGRIKELINRGGEKIAPREIEAVVLGDSSVQDAVAYGVPDPRLGEEIAIAVVPAPNRALDPKALRDRCASLLSDFKVPRHVMVVGAIARTASGKVIRSALPSAADLDDREDREDRDAVSGEDEIRALFGEVLHRSDVGATDDFFRLGGDSILAQAVIRRLGVRMAALFSAPTPRSLAHALASGTAGATKRERGWSSGQLQQLLLHEMNPDDPGQHVSRAWRLPPPVDEAALALALADLVERHEILRASLDPEWRVLDRVQVDLHVDPPVSLDADLLVPFARGGPAIRFRLHRDEDGGGVLQATMHHAVTDDRSMEIFEGELAEAYRIRMHGLAPSWPMVRFERTARPVEPHLAYWQSRLSGQERLRLPDDGTVDRADRRSGRMRWEIDPSRLRELSRAEGVTPFAILTSALMVLLGRYGDRDQVTLGVTTSGREDPESFAAIGLFANLLVLRSPRLSEQSFLDLVLAVRDELVEAHTHQIPFAKLVPEVTVSLRRPAPAQLERVRFEERHARADLSIDWLEDGSVAEVVYRRGAISAASVAAMLAHFETLLGAALADPERSIEELPIAAPSPAIAEHREHRAERTTAVSRFERRIEVRSREQPEAIALEANGERVTYGELWERSSPGSGRHAIVVLEQERSVPLVVSMLSAMRSDASFLALDPSLPALRKAELRAAIEAGGSQPDLAYVIFTSGSTGSPKGVMIEHRSLIALWSALIPAIGLTSSDVVLAVTSPSFDISLVELLFPLASGAKVVLAPSPADAALLCELIDSTGATFMQATPSVWRSLCAAGWRGSTELTALSGGEELTPDLAEALLSRTRRLFNLYGPTEATIWATCDEVRSRDVSIGRPLPHVWIDVLDARGRQIPIGVAGELYLGGAGLARGYLGRDDLTQDRFVMLPRGRAYRTGDRVVQRADGKLHWLGRTDDQIKIRGARVEPAEIDRALRSHPSIHDVVVLAHDGLSALIVAREEVSAAELRSWLRERFPSYMIPSRIAFASEIPRTVGGKIDRERARAAIDHAPRPEETEDSRTIASIWREMLGRDPDLDDDFFRLGGSSLQVAALIAKLRAAFGVELEPSAIFESPVLWELAARVRSEPRAAIRPRIYQAERRLYGGDPRPRRTLLLTGATGFVGAFLLAELAKTDLQITCLVRAPSEAEARARLREALRSRGIDASIADRCGIAAGELPLALDLDVDAVLHAAAKVDLLRPHRDLSSANVLGTKALLEMGRPIHFVSTMSADDPSSGYGESKRDAEELVHASGLPSVIYRLGTVTAHVETGAANAADLFHRRLSSMVRSGIAPIDDAPLSLVPVDRAATAMVSRMMSPGSGAHDVACAQLGLDAVVRWIESRGTRVQQVPREDWLAQLERDESDPLHPFVPLLRRARSRRSGALLEPLPMEPFDLEWLAPQYHSSSS